MPDAILFQDSQVSDDQNLSTQPELFKALARDSTLAARVTGQIENLIVTGHLQPGDRLPPERELARQFGVSRTVVREAVRALVAKSLLEVRSGSGTIVRSPTAESVSQSMALFLRAGQPQLDYARVHEVRRLLEVEIAGLAAERHTAEDLARMGEILGETDRILGETAAGGDDRDRFAGNDVAFHDALARATHNELFVLLLDSIVDVMIQVRQMAFDVPGTPARAFGYHRAIFEQVKAGDPGGARQAMREHLIDSEEIMRRALALHADRILDDVSVT
jgi:GntR family transcriptional repressor for pyruvate dehydrogenase complex